MARLVADTEHKTPVGVSGEGSTGRREQPELALGSAGVEGGAPPRGKINPPAVATTTRRTDDERTVERRLLEPSDPHGEPEPSREQEFFIPVHGEIRLRQREVAIVNHPAFQRLGEIYQLGQTYLVYRGATHKRIEHALGTVHVAQLMIDAIARNSGPEMPRPKDSFGSWNLGSKLREEEVAFIRLGALLHDIGHLPAGHTLEDELGRLLPHDGDERLNLVLDRTDWHGAPYPRTLRQVLDKEYAGYVRATGLTDSSGALLTPSHIIKLLVSKDEAGYRLPEGCAFRLAVCRDIIGNTICADLLDYLHRDWLHLGKQREFDKRLLGYMEIRTHQSDPQDARLVINLRSGHRVRTDAVTAILDLLESRYQLAEIALFHRTKCCAAAMLERVVAELADTDGGETFLASLPEQLLECSDSEMLVLFDKLLQSAEGSASTDKRDRLAGARRLVRKLRQRNLHREFVAYPEFSLADVALEVQNRYTGPTSQANSMERARIGSANRLAALRLLEADFAMKPGSLVMYCPPRKMNTKIAEVKVLVHRDVHTLDSLEKDHGDRGVTGGHLKAQKERFRRLWRVVFALELEERERLDELDLLEPLGRAINLCVLGILPQTGSLEHSVRALARELTLRRGSPLYGHQMADAGAVAARTRSMTAYPGGTMSLLGCVKY